MVAKVELTLNGRPQVLETDSQRSLLEVLREDLGLTGTKYGCGEGDCRACTVLLEGTPVPSCSLPLASVAGLSVSTIEGLADGDALHPVQQAFVDGGAMQCGYCVPGMILRAVALLRQKPHPDRQEIATALNGNLCRCCAYSRILDAVEAAARGGQEPGGGR